MDGIHVAALFPSGTEAQAAEAALLAAGVPQAQIAIIDGEDDEVADDSAMLWGAMKQVHLPDEDAHLTAEAVSRGHAVLVAHLAPGSHDAALAALKAAGPLSLEEHAETWRAEGWDGIYEGEAEYEYEFGEDAEDDEDEIVEEDGEEEEEAAGSGGMSGDGLMTGDYGSVGGTGSYVDTDILRGKHFLAGPRNAIRIGGHGNLRVYEIR